MVYYYFHIWVCRYEDMFAEMRWQKKLRTTPILCKAAQHMSLWGTISFNFAVLINILVAILYPFGEERAECKYYCYCLMAVLTAM